MPAHMPFYLESIQTQRIDIDLKQPIKMSFGTIFQQNIVLVRIRDRDGNEGIGEASILGGPFWGYESAESVQAVIEQYIKPSLLKTPIWGMEETSMNLSNAVRGNPAARSAVEMAILDLLGRRLNISSIDLLGGACRSELPVAWTLSTGSCASDIAEAERAFSDQGHRRFKVKLGREDVPSDVARVIQIIKAMQGRATVIADVNQGWDQLMALRYLAQLQDAGLEAIEQPLPVQDIAGLLHLRRKLSIDIIADEALGNAAQAFELASCGAVTAFALKPNRDGGAMNTKRLAAIAHASGIKLYGGTALETSIGTAANALIYASVPALQLGSELFGPLRLADDLVEQPLKVESGMLKLPAGPGLGIKLDEDRVEYLVRRTETSAM